MNFTDFKHLVDEAKLSHPAWFGLPADSAADDAHIEKAESSLGVQLPKEYTDFVKEFGGGFFALGLVYSLDEASDINLVSENMKYEKIRGSYVIFSDNGAGDFYGFKVDGGLCESQIYIYDHEIDEWGSTPSYGDLFEYLKTHALTN